MTSDLHAELADAGRTALEVIRRERRGDLRGVVDLVTTYGDDGKGLIIGALASIITTRSPLSTSWPSHMANYFAARTYSTG